MTTKVKCDRDEYRDAILRAGGLGELKPISTYTYCDGSEFFGPGRHIYTVGHQGRRVCGRVRGAQRRVYVPRTGLAGLTRRTEGGNVNDLIAALTILAKYQGEKYAPTHCEHDILMVVGVEEQAVSPEDAKRLDELGFHWDDEVECWASFRFGSA